MHPNSPPRRRRTEVPPWFGNTLHWSTPARPRFLFPMRSTHYAGRDYELVKFTLAQAQHLGLSTNGWRFTEHPHPPTITGVGMGPALSPDLASALMLAEAWLLSPRADVLPNPSEPTP